MLIFSENTIYISPLAMALQVEQREMASSMILTKTPEFKTQGENIKF